MTIKTGDSIPAVTLKTMAEDGPKDVTTEEIFSGKKVVLFAVPGAFTPGCSQVHLPGYVVNADKIKAKGVDTIVCMAVNDAFVMGAWGKAQNADEILMLADGNAEFTKALGLEFDGSGFGLGQARHGVQAMQRFAMIVDDKTVTILSVETGSGVDVSAAEKILEAL